VFYYRLAYARSVLFQHSDIREDFIAVQALIFACPSNINGPGQRITGEIYKIGSGQQSLL
jgi:hypothetical protein